MWSGNENCRNISWEDCSLQEQEVATRYIYTIYTIYIIYTIYTTLSNYPFVGTTTCSCGSCRRCSTRTESRGRLRASASTTRGRWILYIYNIISIISTISGKERARSNLSRVLAALGFSDWLVVYLVARNIDRALFTTLATVWRV